MMRSAAYNRFGVLMGTSSRASSPRWLSLRGNSLLMITLISSQGDFCATAHALLDFRLSLPEDWARDEQRRQACHVPPEVRYHTRHEQCLEMLDRWREQVPHGWVTGDDELGRHTWFRG